MNPHLSCVKQRILRLVIKQHHVDEEQQNAGSRFRAETDAPFIEDEEDQVSEERQHEDQLRNKLKENVLEFSQMSVKWNEKRVTDFWTAMTIRVKNWYESLFIFVKRWSFKAINYTF